MKRSRFTEEQIIGILKEHQAGVSAAELCRKHGVSDATFYKWRSKYGGMEVSEFGVSISISLCDPMMLTYARGSENWPRSAGALAIAGCTFC